MTIKNKKWISFLTQACLLLFICAALGQGQTERWIYRYDGPAHDYDLIRSITQGTDGNLYATGYSIGSGTSYDLIVVSLTTDGDTNWIYRYDGPANGFDAANSIVYGNDGNIYVAGQSRSNNTENDFIVISLTSNGDTNWVYRYDGADSLDDEANAIVYGADDNIYAAGYSYISEFETDFIAISLTSDGDTNWVYRYHGPGNGNDEANSIVYGADGNIYAAGKSRQSSTFIDFTVISLTVDGDTNWIYAYNGPGNSTDIANTIVYGSDGNIYTAGYSWGTNKDFTVISLTTDGDTNWTYRYDGPGLGDDEAYSIVYAADGNIYTAGVTYGTYDDFTVISLDSSGTKNWDFRYNGSADSYDNAQSISYGPDGNIYAAGCIRNTGYDWDFSIVSLNPIAGDTNWVYMYNGPGNNDDRASSIIFGSDGQIYAAGHSSGVSSYNDITVISLKGDSLPPQITLLDTWPDTSFTGPYPVDAEITDNFEVASASLFHRKNRSAWDSVSMTQMIGDTFIAEIPAATLGDTIDYFVWASDPAGYEAISDTISFIVLEIGISENLNPPQLTFSLSPITPNPCLGKANISYTIPFDNTKVILSIYNTLGQCIRTLVNSTQNKGKHQVIWDGKSDSGEILAGGVYFYILKADKFNDTKKMLMLR